MKDATDVTLETDRLDQLLEAPAPAQPVVMIQYRNRGVPWWVLVPLLFLVPLVAILVYHHSVVEGYRDQAADATHLMETWAAAPKTGDHLVTDPTTGAPGASQPTVVAAAGPQSTVAAPNEPATLRPAVVATGTTVSAPAPGAATISGIEEVKVPAATGPGTSPAAARSEQATALAASADPTLASSPASRKLEDSPKTDSDETAQDGLSGGSLTGGGQPPRVRVRSNFSSPFEPESHPAASNGAAGAPIGPGNGSSAKLAADESHKANVASSGARDGGASGERSLDDHSAVAGRARGTAALAPRETLPVPEPLPSKEELDQQIAEESARKERDMAEERAVRTAGILALRYEDRVKFHKELRQILDTHGKLAGPEVDKLARRSGHDYNQAAYAQARNIWRHGKMSQQAKVNRVRSLDIPEPAILDFMSDNLVARLRTPGGPRDDNEVRMRAAQLLLSFELPAAPAAAAPGAPSVPAKTLKPRETGGRRPQ